jgi:hypothetical protein
MKKAKKPQAPDPQQAEDALARRSLLLFATLGTWTRRNEVESPSERPEGVTLH